MLFTARKGQVTYGEDIGILLLDSCTPFIHGDVGNAKSYDYPVRYKVVEGLTVTKIFNHDMSFVGKMVEGARELERAGVKAVTGDCGFMAIYQEEVKEAVDVPVFLSSLLQVSFIRTTLPRGAKIGILTANAESLTPEVFRRIGVEAGDDLVIRGLEKEKNFKDAVVDEIGTLDSDLMRAEMVSAAKALVADDPDVKSILMECSMMPPYGIAVQEATGLPVYDFLTMIDFVQSALAKKRFADSL